MEKVEIVLELIRSEKQYQEALRVYEEALVSYDNSEMSKKDFDAVCEETIRTSNGYQNALIITRKSGYFNCPTCNAVITPSNILLTFTTADSTACATCYDPTPMYSEGE